jgi:MFS family permease
LYASSNAKYSIYQQYYAANQLKTFTLSDISWIGSVQIFLNFAGGLAAGPILDRYGTVVCSLLSKLGKSDGMLGTSIF